MKLLIRQMLPVAGLFLLAACGGNETKDNNATKESATQNTADPHAGHDHAKKEETPATGSVPKLKDDKLNAIYEHYATLTTALIDGNAAQAKIAANAIETGAKAVTGAEKIATSAAVITTSGDIEAQRKAYSTLSNEFIALAKKSGMNSGILYVDYCPMAMNDKGGYWISAGKDIKNPYFGDKMMTCGEVKETIN